MKARAWRAFIRTNARAMLAYRLNFTLGLFAMLFQLLAMLSIWGVLLRSGASVGGYTWPEMKAYLLIAYATGTLVSIFADTRMAVRIRDGMVAVDLTKPVDFQQARFAETLGLVVVEGLFISIVIATTVVLLGGDVATPPPGQLALFVVSLLFVVPLKFCVGYLGSMLCFWTQNFFGVWLLRASVVNLFSGALIPLSFLPGWLQAIAAGLPFASITFTPALIYLGRATGADAVRLLAIQAAWTVGLWFGSRLLWRYAVRQLTVHGG